MVAKRIIPCLDVKGGRVVKGVNFVGLKDVGDPVEIAKQYELQGADELCFLDITASHEGRETMREVVERCADVVFMPLTVGGGLKSVAEIKAVLRAGADKVSLNSSAVKNEDLISAGADIFGKQCMVVAIDAKRVDGHFEVFINGGRIPTGLDAIEWAVRAQKLGAGELLVTSMDTDGVKNGYDIELLDAICREVNIPVIASGGAGKLEHFSEVFKKTGADAALAASLFHYGELKVRDVKEHLYKEGISVRR
ncbi:MAG: imidazole glycerol phosphate synthase subunit HisF [Clostridia bacterium]|nr:imidazole glycerol phosphate synthase subunit HisF [Clostridia bacterium]